MKFAHVTISVKNLEESIAFYDEVVGLPLVVRLPDNEGFKIAFIGDGETKLELIEDKHSGESSNGSGISIGFEVESVERARKTLRDKKIKTSDIVSPGPMAKFLFFSDPNGVKIQFVEYIK